MSDDQKAETMEKRIEEGEEKSEVVYHGWKAMPYVIGNETFEKLGTIGTSSNLLVYLTTVYHIKSASAATILNLFMGTTNLAPLFGAFLSDTYFGRYATIGVACVASLLGMLILTLTAAISKLHPPACKSKFEQCHGPTPPQLAFLFASFILLVIGAGGIRPCNLPFGADQFDPRTDSGRRGINSFFNWYYFTFTVAMMISSTLIIYVQSNISWTIGLGIPAILMLFACILFLAGSRVYAKVKPEGSPFTSVAQVLVAAFNKRKVKVSGEEHLFDPPHLSGLVSKIPHTDQFRILDKAAIATSKDEIRPDGEASNPWRLCTLQQVEEVKCIVRVIPIWSCGVIYSIPVFQHGNYVVYQALQTDRHLGKSGFEIPAGSFVVFNMLALTIWIPIYDQLIVPWLRKITKHEGGLTLLQRMGAGMLISILATIVATFVEQKRRNLALNHKTIGFTSYGGAISSMSSLWLVPQLALFGFSEAFNIIGQIEFCYKQFPENMRSVASAIVLSSLSISNYVCGMMVTIVHRVTGKDGKKNWLNQDLNEARLDLFYITLAVIGSLNFFYFLACAKWYRFKGAMDGKDSEVVKENKEREISLV
ncbi:hypothetical protein LUZ60_005271 [Juncus effusus]|nr:hypothetical protein LUZ60_005271 [Juncus effusus]